MRNKLITRTDVEGYEYREPSKLRKVWWKFLDCDFIPTKVKYKYWAIIPYDYRPHNIYYNVKCFFKKYTTVKPRQLNHQWHDRSALLPYMMFEILSQFVEQEMVNSVVEWYGEHSHKVEVNGVEVFVADEALALYNWWHLKYLKAYPEIEEQIWDKIHALEDGQDPFKEIEENGQKIHIFDQGYLNEEAEEAATKLIRIVWDIEVAVQNELIEKMCRLSKIHRSLWT